MQSSHYIAARAPRGRWVIAHRGNSGTYPENTMPAFRSALELGADAIELDVHLSADGEVIVMHDDRLHRTCTGSGHIADLDSSYILEQDAGSWKSDEFKGTPVPLLREVFAEIPLPVMVEIKPEGENVVQATVDVIREAGAEDRAIIASFHDENLDVARKLLPESERLVLGDPEMERWTFSHIAAPHFSEATPSIALAVHVTGGALWCWTADSHEDIQQVIDLGADGIITNEPGRAIAMLG